MDDQSNIFEGSEQNLDQGKVQEQTPGIPESLSEFVGEGKKYASLEKALESIAPAQQHIQKIESEMADLRAKLDAQTSLEETLKNFNNQQVPETPTSQPVDYDEVVSKVTQKLAADNQAKARAANQKEVVGKLSEQFGDAQKAQEAFVAKAKELGMSVSDMDALAGTSPQAIYQMFGTAASTKSQPAMQPSVNSGALESAPKPKEEIPGIMFGASTEEVVDAFRKAKNSVQL